MTNNNGENEGNSFEENFWWERYRWVIGFFFFGVGILGVFLYIKRNCFMFLFGKKRGIALQV